MATPTALRTVKAVFFDLDDTLVLTSQADRLAYTEVAALAQQLLPEADLDGAQLIADWRLLFVQAPWDPHGQVEVEAWRAGLWLQALEGQGIEGPLEEVAPRLQARWSGARMDHFRFLPGVEPMVRELQQQGYGLAVITNGHARVQRQKLVVCGAQELFSHMLVGGEELAEGREEKPHPSIFHRACEMVGCRPHEAVHVGDSLKADVQGGINAGLAATVWVDSGGQSPPAAAPRPTYIVRSVLDLPPLLPLLERR